MLYSRSRARVSGQNEKLSVCELEFSWRTHRADPSRLRIAHERNLTPHRPLALPPRPFDVYRPVALRALCYFYFILFSLPTSHLPFRRPKGRLARIRSSAGVKAAGAFFEGVSRGQHVSPWPRAWAPPHSSPAPSTRPLGHMYGDADNDYIRACHVLDEISDRLLANHKQASALLAQAKGLKVRAFRLSLPQLIARRAGEITGRERRPPGDLQPQTLQRRPLQRSVRASIPPARTRMHRVRPHAHAHQARIVFKKRSSRSSSAPMPGPSSRTTRSRKKTGS